MNVRDLSVDELKALIKEAVEEKLEEMLGDPDQGLELQDEVRGRLQRSVASTKRGERGIPAKRVAKELSLEW